MFKALIILLISLGAAACATAPAHPRLDQYRQGLLGAAQQGDATAQFQLGMTYCCGYDPARNNVTARMWLCRSARQGYAPAQYQLGRYYDQHAVKWRQFNAATQEIVEAHMWYSLAADQGDDMAALYMATLEREMSPRALREAQQLKAHWKDKACSDVAPAGAHRS